jgi:tetratricopeptide (TPR) repeat protein
MVMGVALAAGLWSPAPRRAAPKSIVADNPPANQAAEFVGRAACARCHAEQDRLWQGSHHDLAMQEANEQTVLGNFNDAVFRKDGVVSRFFRRDGRFMVRTDGPDRKLADFEIKYTFGVTPLQQYLVEFPGGRLQALSIAWDSRPKAQGGQHWFHLYPNEKIDPTDELHWTKLSQNWNFMCAECHSTHLQKNYDPASRSYHTTWSEIDVACEACHGPGSRHLAWAEGETKPERLDGGAKGLEFRLDERYGIQWSIDRLSGNARRSAPRATAKEIEMCARCHARRGQWFADYRYGELLMNTHLPALLQETLYHADGQIDGEVYEYGSFLQSRMYQAGVTCSDCHEPHSLKLRAPGNGVCLQCHGAEKYATAKHHFHRADSEGAQCVGCHMPAKAYMVVDPRRDHSFRIPRPDLSVKLGTPNACTGCHGKKPARWAAAKLRQWYGHDPKGYQDYAETLHAARTGVADAETRLVALLREKSQPALARATAAAELSRWLSPDSLPALAEALADTDPRVRAATVEALASLPLEQRWMLAHTLLRDPVRGVRVLTASTLAGIPAERIPSGEQADFQKAADDYLASQRLNADEAGAQVNLGNFHAARSEYADAEAAFREALMLNPEWVPGYANLADLYRQTGRDAEVETLLREGLARQPKSAALFHSLGLWQVRQKHLPAALASLKRAAELAPDEPRFAYVYAVALDSTGRRREARAVVETGLKRVPGDPALSQLRSHWAMEAR